MWIAIPLLIGSAIVCLAAGRGSLLTLQGGTAWIVSLVMLVAALATIGYAKHKRIDGILIDKDNRISLSRLHLVLWTLLIMSGLQAAGIFNTSIAFPLPTPGEVVISPAVATWMLGPLDIRIPPEIWALLGLGSFTAVAAPLIKSRNRFQSFRAADEEIGAIVRSIAQDRGTQGGRFIGRVYQNAIPGDARWIDLVLGDYEEGAKYIDISKVQHLVLTILLLLVYGLALYEILNKSLPLAAAIPKFPDISPGMLSLLGISHAAFLAGKVGQP